MNGKQLIKVFSRLTTTRDWFFDICAVDKIKLPPFKRYCQYFIIVNTARSAHPGLHWVVLFKPKRGKCIFIDSLGKKPKSYNIAILDCLLDMTRESDFLFNFVCVPFALQSNDSIYCGIYCIFIVSYLCKGFSFDDILSWFDRDNTVRNDKLIITWFKKNVHF